MSTKISVNRLIALLRGAGDTETAETAEAPAAETPAAETPAAETPAKTYTQAEFDAAVAAAAQPKAGVPEAARYTPGAASGNPLMGKTGADLTAALESGNVTDEHLAEYLTQE